MAKEQLITKPETIVAASLGLDTARLFKKLLQQNPEPANAIIFLQGDRLDRAPAVVSLYKSGLAHVILITGNNDLIGPGKRNEENDIHLSKLKAYLLKRKIPEMAIMIDDQSLNTLEQAITAIRIAKEKRWSTLLVVTSPFHILRAYLTFLKQAELQDWIGKIIMHAAELSWNKPPSGRIKTAREMLAVEMGKIIKYASDLATVVEAKL